jgi:hypothetical protein
MWDALPKDITGLSLKIDMSGLRQRSHSNLIVPWDSGPRFTVLDSRLLQSGGPGDRMYPPQEHVPSGK